MSGGATADAATLRDVLVARTAADPELPAFDDGRRSLREMLLEGVIGQAGGSYARAGTR